MNIDATTEFKSFNITAGDMSLIEAEKTARIEQVIKALGTMVLQPEFETDPNTFQKRLVANNQVPILQGEDRTKVLNKLVELIVE